MKFKETALMAAVFLGLVLYYFFVDVPAEQRNKDEKERAEKILPLEMKEVVEFSLTRKGEPITLKRNTSQDWALTHPTSAQADSNEIETFLEEVISLKKTRVVEENPNDLSLYGLNDPFLKIHFKFADNTEEALLLGDESPMGGHLYFKRLSRPAVMMAATSHSRFDKSSYNFRDKTLLHFSTGSVTRIQITRDKHSLEMHKNEGDWVLSGEVEAQGDKDSIMNFLQSIQLTRVKEFVDENPESLEPYGLYSPKLELIIENENGKTQTLTLGNPNEDKGYFCKINDSKNILLADTKLFNALSKKPVEFLDKTLLGFEEKEIIELSLRSNKQNIHLVRGNNEGWDIQSPILTAANLSTVNSLLFDLKEARISEFVKISLDIPEAFGLDKPEKSFRLKMKNGKTWAVNFGNSNSNGQQVFANRTNESTVFLISNEVVGKLFRSLQDLRNNKLLEFASDEVSKIAIQTADQLFELHKDEAEWSLETPQKMKTPHIGRDLVWALQSLEFNSIVTPPLADNLSGLNPPLLTIRLWDTEQKKIVTLRVGKFFDAEQEYMVKVENNPNQYRVKNTFLNSIPLKLEDFKP